MKLLSIAVLCVIVVMSWSGCGRCGGGTQAPAPVAEPAPAPLSAKDQPVVTLMAADESTRIDTRTGTIVILPSGKTTALTCISPGRRQELDLTLGGEPQGVSLSMVLLNRHSVTKTMAIRGMVRLVFVSGKRSTLRVDEREVLVADGMAYSFGLELPKRGGTLRFAPSTGPDGKSSLPPISALDLVATLAALRPPVKTSGGIPMR